MSNISENAKEVLTRRYLAKDETGHVVESIDEMWDRIANSVAEAELPYLAETGLSAELQTENYDAIRSQFREVISSLDFLPNSPTLMNAGRPLGQLAACFVLPVEDSMEGIFDTIKNAALIHKSGGGTGFSFSRIRPEGSTVKSTGGVASGPISFMKAFDAATESVKQGGTRRGANMGLLRVDHPDIMKFITCKNDLNTLNNFNISVGITDAFMEAVENNEKYDLVDPHTHEVVDQLDANMVFDTIVNSAWKTGEPGIFFIDRVNQFNTLKDVAGEVEAPNPCVRGDTLITTETGDFPIKQLAGLPVRIWNGDTWSTVVPRVTGHNQKMIKVTVKDTNDGTIRSMECTPYHKFILRYGDRIEARKLEIGMQLAPYRLPSDDLDMFTPFIENKVIALEEAPVADHVYCFTEYMNHSGVFNGILAGNCGGATRS